MLSQSPRLRPIEASAPPLLSPSEPPLSAWGRTRWWIHVVVLGSYPLVLGLVGSSKVLAPSETMLPKDPGGLMILMGATMLQFALFLGVAWLFSRATKDQMLLPWHGGFTPVWRGFIYSIAMRLVIMVVGFLVVLVVLLVRGSSVLESLKPSTEKLIDPEALAASPLYLILNLTVVSFIVAGFREELWRAGVMAGLWTLFPKLSRTLWGQLATVSLLALVFGLGHLPQGWLGVAQTTLLGLCLGAVLVFHRSLWEAALAHGFFDATSFVLLYLYGLLKGYL